MTAGKKSGIIQIKPDITEMDPITAAMRSENFESGLVNIVMNPVTAGIRSENSESGPLNIVMDPVTCWNKIREL